MKKEKKTARLGHDRIFIKCFHRIYMRGDVGKNKKRKKKKKRGEEEGIEEKKTSSPLLFLLLLFFFFFFLFFLSGTRVIEGHRCSVVIVDIYPLPIAYYD